MLDLLLPHLKDADFTTHDSFGSTPLHSLLEFNRPGCETATFFAKAFVKRVDVRGEPCGDLLPWRLAWRWRYKCRDLIDFLISSPDVWNGRYGTPLHQAVMESSLDSVLWLLDLPYTQVNATDEEGQNVLHLVRDDSILDVLLPRMKPSDFGTRDQRGSTPLHSVVGPDGPVLDAFISLRALHYFTSFLSAPIGSRVQQVGIVVVSAQAAKPFITMESRPSTVHEESRLDFRLY
jgi:hypothetical protein